MSVEFKKLFEPIKIGKKIVKNRICMPSMCMNFAGPDGETTELDVAYYAARAKGGAGLITIDYACVSPEGRGMPGQRGIWDDKFIPGLAMLANVIKALGATTNIQLHHAGINAITGEVVGPSRLSNQYYFISKPRELSTEEVEQLVEKFASAALRAKMAGIDMVEVHGTHGYLVCQFLSPITNRRTDKYGRDRALFAIEIVRAIKKKCGEDYPVIFRLCADEFVEGGITLNYAKEVAKRLEDAGVDMLNVTGGNYDTLYYPVPPMYVEGEEGEVYYRFIKLASEIKKVVNIPVCSGGLILDPKTAEKVLEENMVDMVFLGRQLIADPDWPIKVMNGKLDDIRPCIACNDGCLGEIFNYRTGRCSVNPLVGYEYKYEIEEKLPAALKKKKILVIGSGPAGLEFARIAAIRGHEVSIVEEDGKIGGTLNIASTPPFKKRLKKLIDWYGIQLKKLGVKITFNTKGTVKLIEKYNPDVVIIATGSEPLIPNIPGIENAVPAEDVLVGKKTIGNDVIIIGGGLVGCETALHLSKQGKNVTLIEALPEVARDMEITSKMFFTDPRIGLFRKYKIKVVMNRPVIEVKKDGVTLTDALGRREFIKGDIVIYAVGRTSRLNKELVEELKKSGKEVYIIGDAKEPRKAFDAIHEAFFTAILI
jgi:2,4-dienoyl-CoA reductase-like NADH-dependent reductase (Old Yellow Enzyme family)/thioredoxin reductase